jgi:hypothetical protein
MQNRGPSGPDRSGHCGPGAAGDQIAEAVGAQAELVGAGRIEQPDKRDSEKADIWTASPKLKVEVGQTVIAKTGNIGPTRPRPSWQRPPRRPW